MTQIPWCALYPFVSRDIITKKNIFIVKIFSTWALYYVKIFFLLKELATEIKSEIREVITTVEDVLSDGFESGPRRQEKDSVSASDVADYLVEVSRGMASELRGIVTEALTSDCNTSSYNTNGSSNEVQPQITSGSHDSGINMTGPDSDPASGSTSKTNKNKVKENKESTTQDTSTKLNVQWHCPPKIIWKPTVDVNKTLIS